jgi:pimeloyl-ACP methyl ester carboxylesterase
MNLRRVDLEVGLNPEDEERMTNMIIPSGVLSHIGPVDICRRLLRHLKKSSRARPDELRVHNYGYDWRLSPHLLSRQLIEFLESLDCNRPYVTGSHRGAVVIAHSLGGLITRHAANQRPDLFAGIIYAGVPQHCINILGPLRNGDDVLLSSRVLTAQVNFTLRTSYALLPESGRCFINKTTGERYDIDFFDVRTWEEHCLSPCVSSSAPAPRPEHRKSILDTLSDSLPSLPLTNKRTSIIRRENSPAQEAHPSLEDVKDAVKDSANNTAQRAEESFPVANPQPLEPSMGSPPSAGNRESIATACTIPRAEALEYLERTLKSVRQFKHELAFNHSHQAADVYPPIAVLYSNSVPTVFCARVDSREAIKRSDAYDNLAFAAGDGIVLSKSARPPDGYKVVRGGLVRSDRGHIGLLGDLEAVGKCLRAIGEARRRGVGTGVFAKTGEEPPS